MNNRGLSQSCCSLLRSRKTEKYLKSLFEAGETADADNANWNMIYARNYKSHSVALGMLLKF